MLLVYNVSNSWVGLAMVDLHLVVKLADGKVVCMVGWMEVALVETGELGDSLPIFLTYQPFLSYEQVSMPVVGNT